MGKGVSRYL